MEDTKIQVSRRLKNNDAKKNIPQYLQVLTKQQLDSLFKTLKKKKHVPGI